MQDQAASGHWGSGFRNTVIIKQRSDACPIKEDIYLNCNLSLSLLAARSSLHKHCSQRVKLIHDNKNATQSFY